MKKSTIVAMAGGLLLVATTGFQTPSLASSGRGEASRTPDGREVFDRKNCQHCHAVSSIGLERTGTQEKQWGPDLSGLSERFTEEEILEFLRRGEPLDRQEGRQHWKSFWGQEDELQALADWLMKLPPVDPEDGDAAGR